MQWKRLGWREQACARAGVRYLFCELAFGIVASRFVLSPGDCHGCSSPSLTLAKPSTFYGQMMTQNVTRAWKADSAWSSGLICLSRRRGGAGDVGLQSPSPGPGPVIIAARRRGLLGREFEKNAFNSFRLKFRAFQVDSEWLSRS